MLLPYFNDRQTPIDMLMFHCSAQPADEMIKVLQQAELSCHYIIDSDGTILQTVSESKRAWHAGTGFWRGIDTDINSHAIGIELSHPTLGQSPYPPKQITALINLSRDIINRYNICPQNIIGHSDSAPLRKPDPGKSFPWKKLAANGIGLWYNIKDADQISCSDETELLSHIGYDVRTPELLNASLYAFARRFAPQFITTDNDIQHLIAHVYPPAISFNHHRQFIRILKAVCYAFNNKHLPIMG